MMSYFMSKRRKFCRALRPKIPYHRYVQKKTGRILRNLQRLSPDQLKTYRDNETDGTSFYAKRNKNVFDAQTSILLKTVNQDEQIVDVFNRAMAAVNNSAHTSGQKRLMESVLNLELLLSSWTPK
jgi:hypothetical protein